MRETLWSLCVRLPWLAPAACLLLHTLPVLKARALWFSDEVRYADVLQNMLHGKWLVLFLGTVPYPDKPPVYFWLLAGLSKLYGGVDEGLFFLGAALSGLALLASGLWLARLTLGDENKVAASGLVMACMPVMAVLAHYSRMDPLFAAVIVASLGAFYLALSKPEAHGRDGWMRWTLIAWALAGLAVLVKGPLGVALPVAAALSYGLYTGQRARLFSRTMAKGAALCAAITFGWLALALLTVGRGFIDDILGHQIVGRALESWHHRESWSYYFAALPVALLPWSLLPLALPGQAWTRLADSQFWAGLLALPREADFSRHSGKAFLWCTVLSGFVLLTAVSIKLAVYLLPLFPALAILAADALLDMPRHSRQRFWTLLAGFFLLLTVAVPFTDLLHLPGLHLRGLGLSTLLTGLLTLGLLALRGGRQGALPLVVAGMALWFLVLGGLVAPSLDSIMTPKPQALRMKDYVAQGYAPVSWRVYPGIYNYYAGAAVPALERLEDLQRFMAGHSKVVLAVPLGVWKDWQNRPADLRLVHEQFFSGQAYVLALRDVAP